MTFPAERDGRFILQTMTLTILALALLAVGFFYRNIFALLLAVPVALTAGMILLQYFRTEYSVGTELLEVRSGLMRVTVEYKNIVLITEDKSTPAHGYVPMATSARKLYVVYVQDGKQYRMETSPADREGFMKALEQCL